jgi:hypothetical protein
MSVVILGTQSAIIIPVEQNRGTGTKRAEADPAIFSTAYVTIPSGLFYDTWSTSPGTIAFPRRKSIIEQMLDQLATLSTSDQGSGTGFIKPHKNAVQHLRRLLVSLESFSDTPLGSVRPDGHGGAEVTWEGVDRAVILTARAIPKTGKTDIYIYVEDGDDYTTVKPVTSENLKEQLEWLRAAH